MNTTTLSPRAQEAARIRTQEHPVDLLTATTLPNLRKRFPHVSVSTLIRWLVAGKRGIRLGGCRIRGKWHTSSAAVDRFIAELDRK